MGALGDPTVTIPLLTGGPSHRGLVSRSRNHRMTWTRSRKKTGPCTRGWDSRPWSQDAREFVGVKQ